MIITCSSDRGLCGAIHSSVSKQTRRLAREGSDIQIAVLGDKAKPQIAREQRKQIKISINQLGKSQPTIADAVSIHNFLKSKLPGYIDRNTLIVYNSFKSVIAYETKIMDSVLSNLALRNAGVSILSSKSFKIRACTRRF